MNDAAVSSQLSRLLDAALDLPPAERVAWVDTLDDTHDGLKPRLRALLARAAEVESRNFMGSLPPFDESDANEDAAEAQPVEAAGGRVGPYQLQRQLGAGGMGAVWLATRADGMFERSIALKLPHRGMFGADLAERMARERGILAGLDHPNIARLYDAGLTADGQPYLALEYVEGVAVDEYCRSRQCDLRERLRLFLQVADAVASAHARLVVHRDLKPANILVTHDGNVRLLDFGIAKLLDAPVAGDAPLTQLSVHAMTPDYASPEQILGDPVTIASDVYSLGVVLFELLTGERPYRLRRDTRGALEEAILQCEPRRPSELPVPHARALRGDLDTIVLKALHKIASDRYATVNALADDLRLYLAGRPVLARPDSNWYRFSRFLTRHKAGAGVTVAVTVALIAAAGIAFAQARAATAAQERAEEVNRFITSIFTSADPFGGGNNELSARDLLKQARKRVDQDFAKRPDLRVGMLNTLTISLSHLSDHDAAEEISNSAIEISTRDLPADSPERRESRLIRLEVLRGRNMVAALRREVDALLAEAARNDAFTPRDRIRLLTYSVHAAIDEGNGEFAATQATEALMLAERLLPPHDDLTLEAAGTLVVALRSAGQTERALAAAERNLAMELAVTPRSETDGVVIDLRMALATLYTDMGRPLDAVRELSAVIAAAPKVHGPDSTFEMFAHSHMARAQGETGNLPAAIAAVDRCLELAAKAADDESRVKSIATAMRAHFLLEAGRHADALREFDAVLPFFRETFGAEHNATLGVSIQRALALTGLGRHREALEALELIAARTPSVKHWMIVSPAHALGLAQRRAGNPVQALDTQRTALAAVPDGPRRERSRMAILGEIGLNLTALGNSEEARDTLGQALQLHARLESHGTPTRDDLAKALDGLRPPDANAN